MEWQESCSHSDEQQECNIAFVFASGTFGFDLLARDCSFVCVGLFILQQTAVRRQQTFYCDEKMSCAFKLCTSACISAGLIAYRYNLTNNIVVVVSLFAALTALAYYILNKAIQRYE